MSLQPDVAQALQFFGTLYPAGGIVHFRAVPEPKDNRRPTNHHYALDHHFPTVIADFLAYCTAESRAAFFLPGTTRPGGTLIEDVLSLPAVLVDLDKGNTLGNLAEIEALIGAPTMTVTSGGTTAEGSPKLHAYWVLEEPAMDADISAVCATRLALAERFGGDRSFQQPAQVIRIPGSLHLKSTPKLVQLRSVTPHRYQLGAITRAVGAPPAQPAKPSGGFFDFNQVETPGGTLDRALTAPVHSEGADEITRYEAAGSALGHFIRMVREGRMTEAEAWEAARGWNLATLVPPWTKERLRQDFDRLVEIDRRTHGPIAAPAIPAAPTEGWSLTDWRADRFQGEPPARVYVVQGVIPAYTPGLFAAPGDAGKSMMVLKLALDVTTAPPVTPTTFPPRFFGGAVIARGAAVILTSEDDAQEVHRRLHALDPQNARAGKALYVVPMISAGGARSILAETPTGPAPTEFWHELRRQLLTIPDLKLVALDPLSSFVAGDTNDNMLGAALMTLLAEIAATTGAAVMVLHHFNKGKGTPANLNEARDAIRGAGALVDNGRWALAMWEADEDRAYETLKTLGQPHRARASGIVYQGGLAKSNAPGEKIIRTMVREPSTGLLEDVTEQIRAATPKNDEVDAIVFKALMAHKMEHPKFSFPKSRKSLESYGVLEIVRRIADLSDRKIEEAIERLVQNGQLQRTEDGGNTPRFEPVS